MVYRPKENVNRETIVWNGRRYNRYPNSPRRSHRVYFLRSGSSLHRDVWISHNGEIPPGHHVHHIDGDTLNNDISNLECVNSSDHFKKHAKQRSAHAKRPEQIELLNRIRVKAAEWHRSPEGRKWHMQHAQNSIVKADRVKWREKLPLLTKNCEVCGVEFVTKNNRKILCGSVCQLKKSRAKRGL